jgi:peptidoglycan/LPS O-acetylase OafA/YrhL
MKRLYALDTLRGVAALAIVVWHWQHFFAVSGDWQEGWQRSAQPLYPLLKPLYEAGWMAVDLFFPLSGFIFFWLYGEQIAARRMEGGRFAWLRFSRLYPLHLATLLAVAIMQYFFLRATGSHFIYDANDWQHFAAGLVLAQQWLPPNIEQSFDGPAWSVSIEVLLYGVFFALCRFKLGGWRTAALVSIAAIFLLRWNLFIARGLMGFFAGGVVFHLGRAIEARADARRIARVTGITALALWAATFAEGYFAPLHTAFYWLVGHISDEAGRFYIGNTENVFLLLFVFAVSPITILALALHERVLGGRWERFALLGDISYSTYMLHFPVQLALALAAAHFALAPQAFEHAWVMAAFYAVLIALGTLSFRAFERPLQEWLRGFARAKTPSTKN